MKKILYMVLRNVLWIVLGILIFHPVWAQEDQPPKVDPIPNQQVAVGDLLTVAIKASDADGDALAIQLLDTLPGFNFTDHGDGTATLTWAPTETQIGTHKVRVQAVETAAGGRGSAIEEFQILVKDGQFVDLVVTKSRDESEVFLKTTAHFHIAVRNQGNRPATGVIITDTLGGAVITEPAGPILTTVDPLTAASCTTRADKRQYVCELGTIPPGTTANVNADVAAGEVPGVLVNQVVASSAELDTDLANNQATVTTRITPRNYADLAIEEQSIPPVVTIYDIIVYSFFYRNLGNTTASNVEVLFSIDGPALISFVNNGTAISCPIVDPKSASCPYENLGTDARVRFAVGVKPFNTGTVNLTASITSDLYDPKAENNNVAQTVEIKRGNADLAIARTASATKAQVGDQVTISLLARNLSSRRVLDIVVEDEVPGMTITQMPDECFHSRGNSDIACEFTLFPYDPTGNPQLYERTFTYVARADVVGTSLGTAAISAVENDDPVSGNDSVQHLLPIEAPKKTVVGVIVKRPIGPSEPISTTKKPIPLPNTPVKVKQGDKEMTGETDENGEAKFDLGDNPEQFSIVTTITETNNTEVAVHLGNMPPTGNATINIGSSEPVTSNLGVTLYTPDETQEVQLPNAQFAWENRTDVDSAAFKVTLNPSSSAVASSRHAGNRREPGTVDIELTIDAVWGENVYLPLILG